MRHILTVLALGLLFIGCAPKSESGYSADIDTVIATRRSVRHFDPTKTISKEEVQTLIATTQEAPTWANGQPVRYHVALSPEKADAVREVIGEWNKKNTEGAHIFIVSTYVKGTSGFFRGTPANEVGDGWGAYDNGLSDAYLILKARAMGFDTLIMGARDAEGIRTIFDIPQEEAVMSVIALGYRSEDPERPKRKDLEEILKFY